MGWLELIFWEECLLVILRWLWLVLLYFLLLVVIKLLLILGVKFLICIDVLCMCDLIGKFIFVVLGL